MTRWLVAWLLASGCDAGLGLEPLAPPAGYAAVVLADHPVAYFPLDETSGISVHDQTGGPDGTILSNVLVGQAPPFPGAKHAMTFDGAIGAIDLGDRSRRSVRDRRARFLRARVEVARPDRHHACVGVESLLLPGPTTGSPSTTKLGFTRETELGTTSRGAFAPAATDQWHHVVGTYDGTAVAILCRRGVRRAECFSEFARRGRAGSAARRRRKSDTVRVARLARRGCHLRLRPRFDSDFDAL